ncbi:MAG TPA: hypothetical protein VFZ66_23270 [Herpetosiphonaceae bacterium]
MGTLLILFPIALGVIVVIIVRTWTQYRQAQHEQQTAIMHKYQQRKLLRFAGTGLLISAALAMVGAIVLGGDMLGQSRNTSRCLMVLLMLPIAAYDLMVWRCPQCNRYLGKLSDPQFCASCGAQLR